MMALERHTAFGQQQTYMFNQELNGQNKTETNPDDIENQIAAPKRKPIKKVLFVDDEKELCKIFKNALERFGYEVRVAFNGNEGMKLFRENPADLIITDLFMPEKDGHTLIYEILQEFPDTKIIAITGYKSIYGMDTELNVAENLGAKQVFTKPIKIAELVKAIKALEIN